MGVAGLWEVLRPAGQVRSLTELAVEDGFNANTSRQRGFRIGIDASIWFFHAACGKEGENPELRTLFFRCCRLLQLPLLPLFVFDGPNRPAVKRGKRVGGNVHWLTQGMKNIIDAFGFEWCVAPGEAEAELAYLNRIGIIDAVLSDDVDNFLFGAIMVIRNPSNTLSGSRAHPVKNAQGKDDGNHVVTYKADAILSDPSVALSRSGTILIGLLSGGDYIPAGLPGCGQKFATGLARAGFGDSLLKAVKEFRGARLDAFLDQWRRDIRNELKTNKSGLLPTKKPSLAASLPDDFPSLPVLMSYADPLTTENLSQKGKRKTPPGVWRNDPDPMRIASLCELYFEWGVKDVIVHRFRTVLWPGIVCRAIRRAVINEDARQRPRLHNARHSDSEEEEDTGGPSSPTKRMSSTLSALTLSSPSKTTSASASDPSPSKSFTLLSLVRLTASESPSPSRPTSPSSPSSSASDPVPLLLEVLSQRTHVSTDCTLEYRVLVNPTTLVERAESGVKGLRPPLIGGLFGIDPEDEDSGALDQDADESGSDDAIERLETAAGAAAKLGTKKRKARREVPTTPLRLWLPACMVRATAPALVKAYEEKVRVREEKKAKRGTKGGRGGRAGTGVKSTSRAKAKDVADDDGDESVPGPSATKTAATSKVKPKAVRTGEGRRRKPKQASEAQDDTYECFDLNAGESPCSSDGESVEENSKGRAKTTTTTRKMDVVKPPTKTGAKNDATSRKVTTNSTVKEFYKTAKPSTVKATKAKSTTSRPSAAKSLMLDPSASKRVYEKEEEEGSTDVDIPPPLPKSSRPLDVLRAKSKSGTVLPNPTAKSKLKPTVVPRYEEESSPSSPHLRPSISKPSASSVPCRPPAKKKPLFVEVSDTDSEIEVSDVRRPLSRSTATMAAHDEVDGGVSVSVGADKLLTTSTSQDDRRNVESGVIDLIAKGSASRSKSAPSTSVPTAPLSPKRPFSAPLVTSTSMIGPTSISRSPSKLDHILLPQPALESDEEDEGSEGDELPTFHRGSAKSKTKKTMKATISRPAPRPFPMQFASESPVSQCASSLKERHESRQDEHDEGDTIEIVDVFTTPRGPSPPRSPTPSPSLVKPLPAYASAGPTAYAKGKQPGGFPPSPTNSTSQASTKPREKTKPRASFASMDGDTCVSGSDRNGILKSPRKSAAHSSPRHVSHTRERASSPTPRKLFKSPSRADGAMLCTGVEASDCRRPQPENPASTCTSDGVGRKPRLSDTSAIYISSGSEDEDNAELGVDTSRGDGPVEAEVDEDHDLEPDAWTDRDADVDGWADTGMILSTPPSPARASPTPESDLGPGAPAAKVLPSAPRASKFKPAPTALKATAQAPWAEFQVSGKATFTNLNLKGMTHDEDIVAPRPVDRAPLLVARAKRSQDRDDDVIDLTSD